MASSMDAQGNSMTKIGAQKTQMASSMDAQGNLRHDNKENNNNNLSLTTPMWS
jgi:hypothetical protein